MEENVNFGRLDIGLPPEEVTLARMLRERVDCAYRDPERLAAMRAELAAWETTHPRGTSS